ncbi:tyrosine-type recombinase/integrase [Ferruginivarius sediminum]|uniref:Site-specific integrase n=1 Tax=Ferruginivarius sediminum TaxID=2661937 RepID=A0A369TG92_9PROT|nr:site-specific integrase [Ferruginivarius sediminum]RDD63832.1 site-specific integrase [Ferruginivarius sediminum]
MARSVRNPKLDTRTARAKLTARTAPYWVTLAPGAQLGYLKGKRLGTWTAKYRDPETGARHQRRLGSADDYVEADGGQVLTFFQAQDAARAFFAECARPSGSEASHTGPYTIADAIQDYLTDFEHRGGKSVDDARTRANALILPQLGEIEVVKLTPKRLKDWHRDLAKEPPRLRTRKGKKQQYRDTSDDPEAQRRRRATANRVLTTLKAALNHAWREGKVTSDDAWRRVTPFREADAARVRYLSNDEITRLVNACEGAFRRLVQGALYTGARYGELIRLQVADFNPDAGTVAVRASKTGKPRHVILTDEGRVFFENITAGQPGDALIFKRPTGGAWGRSHQQRPLGEACARAKIAPAVSFHILRHTYASHLAMRGVPLQVIATNLGHTDTRMVERHYGHLSPSYVADAIRGAGLGFKVPGEETNVERLRPERA